VETIMKQFSLILAMLLVAAAVLLVRGVPAAIRAGEKRSSDQRFVVKVSELIHEDDIIVTQVEIEAQPGSIVEVISDKPNRGGITAASPEPTSVDRSPRTRLILFGDHVVWEAGSTNVLKFMMKIKAGSGTATMTNTGPMPKEKRLEETLSVLIEPGEYQFEAATKLVRFQDVTYSLIVRKRK
jgi:hypothetical protein